MPVIDKRVVIDAPAAQIFALIDDLKRQPVYAPGVSRVEEVQRTAARIGDSYRVTYSVLGLGLPLQFVTTDWAHNERIGTRLEGSMGGTFAWRFTPQDHGTAVAVQVAYQVRGGIVGKAMNAWLLERMNEKNIERMLENVKLIAETEAEHGPE